MLRTAALNKTTRLFVDGNALLERTIHETSRATRSALWSATGAERVAKDLSSLAESLT